MAKKVVNDPADVLELAADLIDLRGLAKRELGRARRGSSLGALEAIELAALHGKKAEPRTAYQPAIAFERLNEMLNDLLNIEEPLDADIRREISDALDCLYVKLILERNSSKSGRPIAGSTRLAAFKVNDLVERGLTPKAAACQVLRGGDITAVETLLRCYRKMKRAGTLQLYRTPDPHLARALSDVAIAALRGNK